MDSQDLGRGRGGLERALSQIRARTLVISIETDVLFPPVEQQFLAEHIPNAQLVTIRSDYGHDGFLMEYAQLVPVLRAFLEF